MLASTYFEILAQTCISKANEFSEFSEVKWLDNYDRIVFEQVKLFKRHLQNNGKAGLFDQIIWKINESMLGLICCRRIYAPNFLTYHLIGKIERWTDMKWTCLID